MCTVLFQCVLKTKTFNPRKFSLESARDELIFFIFFTVYVMELFSTFTEAKSLRGNAFFGCIYIIYISLDDFAKQRPI